MTEIIAAIIIVCILWERHYRVNQLKIKLYKARVDAEMYQDKYNRAYDLIKELRLEHLPDIERKVDNLAESIKFKWKPESD